MLSLYKYLTYFLFPFFIILIFLRTFLKKEDKFRYKEKIFRSHFKVVKDNNKKLVWFHAASIGECLSIIPLINEINNNHKNVNFLITTVSLSSSRLLEKKLKKYSNILHRFLPLDLESLAEEFLTLWNPNLVCFVDSEIWPNFLFKIKEKKISLLLINARLTKKTFYKWKMVSNFAKKVFFNFDLCLAASEESKNNLSKFKVKKLKYIGNLKYSVKSITDEIDDSNKKILDKFESWCAVSTHKGEELIILKTHSEIKKKYKNILTIIIPRHIHRCIYIQNLSKKLNLNSQIFNENETISPNVEILIINSFGVLPKYFNYCKNIFIGKSFIKEKQNDGGQNPLEAAKLGCKIFHGPYVYNFQEVYDHLKSYGLAQKANDEKELSEKLMQSFKYPNNKNLEQINLLNNYGEKILKQTFAELNTYLR